MERSICSYAEVCFIFSKISEFAVAFPFFFFICVWVMEFVAERTTTGEKMSVMTEIDTVGRGSSIQRHHVK